MFSIFDRGDGFSLAQCINRKCFLGEQLLMWDIPEFECLVVFSALDHETYFRSLLGEKKKKKKKEKKGKSKISILCLANLHSL